MNRLFISIVLAFLLGSCVSTLDNDKGNELARVGNKYLYENDIKGLVPSDATTRDSLVMVRNYVDTWVRTQLMLKQASKNIAIQKLDLEKQLEDYRNSLIIYHYETELIRQQLDTLVSEEEIARYYKDHKEDFALKENIAKAYYMIAAKDSEEEEMLEEIYTLPDSVLFDSLETFGKTYARAYWLDTATWVYFNDLMEIIPIETYNQELFLRGNRKVSLTDDEFTYLLTFVDFRIKDDISPLDLETADIRKIIINKRKMKLIKKVREDIYDKANEQNEFEIYYE